jgi:O-antigen/teichoic acid export membrane protein
MMGLATLATNALLTRLLPPDTIGIYFIVFSLVSGLALIAQAGMQHAVVKLVAEAMSADNKHLARSIIHSTYSVVLVTTLLICAAFSSGAGAWISNTIFDLTIPNTVIYIASAWLAALTFRSLIAETFRGLQHIKYATVFGDLLDGIAFCFMLCILFILHTQGELGQVILLAVLAAYLNIFSASIILYNELKNKPQKIQNHNTHIKMRKIVSNSWPLWITSITLFVLSQSDLWIIGILREQQEVGVYGAVKRLALLVPLSLTIANSVLPPLIAELNAKGEHEKLEQALRGASTVAALPALFALVLFILGAKPILAIIYGEYYGNGATILVTLSLGQLVNVWSGSCANVLMMTGHQVALMKIGLFCGIITISLAIYLTSILGGLGAAISASIGLALQNILMLFAVRRYLGIWTQIDIRLILYRIYRP